MNPFLKILPAIVILLEACTNLSYPDRSYFPSAYDLALQASRARIQQKYNTHFDTLNIQQGLLLFEVFDYLIRDRDVISCRLNSKPVFSEKQIGADSYFEYLSIPNLVNNVLEIIADGTGEIIPATVAVRFPYYSPDTFRLKLEKGKSHFFIINCLNPAPNFELLQSRILYVTDSVEVQHQDISFSVSDYGLVDGDLIAAYLNDSLVIPCIELSRYSKTFTLSLQPGAYTLGIHALSEGYVSPNTTSLSIEGINKNYGLISDARISAALKIRVVSDSLTSKSQNDDSESKGN